MPSFFIRGEGGWGRRKSFGCRSYKQNIAPYASFEALDEVHDRMIGGASKSEQGTLKLLRSFHLVLLPNHSCLCVGRTSFDIFSLTNGSGNLFHIILCFLAANASLFLIMC